MCEMSLPAMQKSITAAGGAALPRVRYHPEARGMRQVYNIAHGTGFTLSILHKPRSPQRVERWA